MGPYSAEKNCSSGYPYDYVKGPDADGSCSYHGGPPHFAWLSANMTPAEVAATYANTGYQAGYSQAQRDIRAALGLKG